MPKPFVSFDAMTHYTGKILATQPGVASAGEVHFAVDTGKVSLALTATPTFHERTLGAPDRVLFYNTDPIESYPAGWWFWNGSSLAKFADTDTTLGGESASDAKVPTQAAVKSYVDSVATGLDIKASVRLATAAALPAYTAAGSGVGKTITINATGVLEIDGSTVALNDRVLVKNETGDGRIDHGLYKCTTAGAEGVAAVLTRATDADSDAEVTSGMFCFVSEGTTNINCGFVLITADPIVVDTTVLEFSHFSAPGSATMVTQDSVGTLDEEIMIGDGTARKIQGSGVLLSAKQNTLEEIGSSGWFISA